MSLSYAELFKFASTGEYDAAAAEMAANLPMLWANEYQAMCAHVPNLLQFDVEGFEHVFDFTSDTAADTNPRAPEDRLVGVFGRSRAPVALREASRMRGFLGGGLAMEDGSRMDKGHFIGHALGGGTEVNLFPQRPELNRGWSDPGKVFRRMERFAAVTPGTFVFACPIYVDTSWQPVALEYGLLMPDLNVWVERFAN